MNYNFEPPPGKLAVLAVVGGIVTAVGAIALLTGLSNSLSKTDSVSQLDQPNTKVLSLPSAAYAQQDAESFTLPGKRINLNSSKTISVAAPQKLTSQELHLAEVAWQYFEQNWNEQTGLVNSVDNFTSVTLWDQSAAIAALVAAYELEIITQLEFDQKLSQMLATLAKISLYNDELPNKVYNSKTLIPVNYGQIDQQEEIGWSAIDLGRMALWLKIVGSRYPQYQSQTEAVWQAWQVERLVEDGEMYGASVIDGEEKYYQEGRLGYENYAAFGFKLWGLDVEKALDFEDKAAFAQLYGETIPFDLRDLHNSGANNYVLSEPYILDGIETGFQALPKAYADQILAAQQARYQATNQLTAITEDNLDREPYFVYNTLLVNGSPWATITDTGENYNHLRFLSAKAAVGWYVLYDTEYTQKLFDFVHENLETDRGWYNGFYETLKEPNTALTANNNGVILECLLYKKVGQPLLIWAGVDPSL